MAFSCVKNRDCPSGCCKNSVCQDQLKEDDPCAADLWCQRGYECQPSIRRCRPRGELALSQCSHSDQCHPDYYCDESNCTPRVGLNYTCQYLAACQDGLQCIDGKCRAKCIFQNKNFICPQETVCQSAGYCVDYKPTSNSKTSHIVLGGIIFIVMILVFIILAMGLIRKFTLRKKPTEPLDIRPVVLPTAPPIFSDNAHLPPPPAYEDVVVPLEKQ